jgi:hypothetical protein
VRTEEAKLNDLSVGNRAAAMAPHLQSLLDDREVQAAIRRLAAAGRKTYERARGQRPTKALNDKRLRRRVQEAAIATWQVWTALDAAQTRPRRPRWRRRLVLVMTAAGGAYGLYMVSNADGREALRGLIPNHDASSEGSS